MMAVGWSWSLLGIWCLLLRLEMRQVLSAECGPGTYQVNTAERMECCKECDRENISKIDPCPNAESLPEACRCYKGFACTVDPCVKCALLPVCKKGTVVKRTGKFQYYYFCASCPAGTNEINGVCKPNATMLPTKPYEHMKIVTESKRIAVQSSSSIPSVKIAQKSESYFHSCAYFAAFTSVGIFVLLLLSILLHLFIWKMKTKKCLNSEAMPETTHLAVNMSPLGDIDSCSCQYPEEEHGEGTIEKNAMYCLNEEKNKAEILT